ncbi:hypothetical protein QTO34_010346 [Cnephaeus nilssonii]|uniref:Uncharacterized protein n=1 Tax=Cnephaeus nilssonii TaxID=3371016 RepID=A0AA40HF69_CNENI|nr:hypothetical protein QTO34_010346 [Eptesicus nilssonii]
MMVSSDAKERRHFRLLQALEVQQSRPAPSPMELTFYGEEIDKERSRCDVRQCEATKLSGEEHRPPACGPDQLSCWTPGDSTMGIPKLNLYPQLRNLASLLTLWSLPTTAQLHY